MTANNEQELGFALKQKAKTIHVSGRFAPKMERLYSMSQIMWWLCFFSLTAAVAALLKIRPQKEYPFTMISGAVAGTPAAKSVGRPLLASAALVALYGGGMEALKQFRNDYHMEQGEPGGIILIRKASTEDRDRRESE